jgi:hypothetical protein
VVGAGFSLGTTILASYGAGNAEFHFDAGRDELWDTFRNLRWSFDWQKTAFPS